MDPRTPRPTSRSRAGASEDGAEGSRPGRGDASSTSEVSRPAHLPSRFDVPVSAIAPLFRARLDRLFLCRVEFDLDVNSRATARVLGGYYRSRRLVRLYVHDSEQGRRPLEELFDTFLHEVAHHLEYTEPDTFSASACGRIPGRMHSRLFWRILGELKYRWARLQRQAADRVGP